MKPKFLKIQSNKVASFSARHDLSPAVNNMWHYHEELELIYIRKGDGIRFIGDKINRFKSGDILLLGENLPHYWRFDQEYFEDNGKVSDVFVIHFNKDFLGINFFEVPENKSLKKLIEQANRGLVVKGNRHKDIVHLFTQTIENEQENRLLNLLNLLYVIGEKATLTPVASLGYVPQFNSVNQERMQAIYNYTFQNYKNKISLEDISSIAKLSTNSFCKFFKTNHKKKYTDFVNEIRIDQACRLLIEDKLMISQICYECGFNNFTSFHKTFKKHTGLSPLQYQKSIL